VTKTIVITSGKGGVGKTTISVNTALEISRRNFLTCLFDADLGLANVDILLGLQPENTLDDVIFGDKELDEIILHPEIGIEIIPGSSGIQKMANLGEDKIADLISSFSQLPDYDYFLIDTSSGISRSVIAFCLASSETILIITSEATSLTDAYALLKVMSANAYKGSVKILVNKCPSVPISRRTYLRFKSVVDKHLDIEIAPAGIVLHDPNIETAIRQQEPVLTLYPNSIGSQCIRAMVSILLENSDREESQTDFTHFWQRYFDFAQSDLSVPVDDIPESLQSAEDDPDDNLSSPNSEDEEPHYPLEENSGADNSQGSIAPFSHSSGIIDPLSLPSPTTLLSKSLELQSQGDLSKDELLEIFSSDPALMAKAMQMFCTPGTVDSNRVTKMHQIMNGLGTEVLSNLIITASMQKALIDSTAPDTSFVNSFWYHSYKSAVLAEQIAETMDYPYPEEAFLTGLMHDIGRLALQAAYPEVYSQIPHTFHHEELLLETETHTFGRSHAEIGAESLRAWNLNSFIADAAQYHIESESRIETGFDLIKIVFIAGQMTQPAQEDSAKVSELASLLSLAPAQLLICNKTADRRVQQVADHFNITLPQVLGKDKAEEVQACFRRQAVDYSILLGVLPGHALARKLPGLIRQIHQGLDILFEIKHTLCFIPDNKQSVLQAVGYPDCFGWKILSDICISIDTGKSLIVESFTTSELKNSLDKKEAYVLSLADEQIIRILDSHGLVCVPMVTRDITRGVIVFGIQKEGLANLRKQVNRLKQFGARSAKNISDSEQAVTEEKPSFNLESPDSH